MDRNQYQYRNENPSFSSTLLDVISRSIDHERDDDNSMRMNRQSIDACFRFDNQITDNVRRKSATGFENNSGNRYSIGAGVSSEGETLYGYPARPRPIRTNVSHDDECDAQQPKANCESKLSKTKSRAMKIYGYLKRSKQPISPGGRLATFLVSLFSTANAKKSKIPSDDAIVHADRKPKSAPNASTSSSFSRSCLIKSTPAWSREKVTADVNRSVRFYPASVQPLSLNNNRSSLINGEVKKHLAERNRRLEETRMNILKSYKRKVEYVFDSIKSNVSNNYEDDDDEAGSYASSDLFELDHLSAIGCMQELPLYETTSVDVNRAIANGLLV